MVSMSRKRHELEKLIAEAHLHKERAKSYKVQYQKAPQDEPSTSFTTNAEAVVFWTAAIAEWDLKLDRLTEELGALS